MNKASDKDWRVTNQEKFLKGKSFALKKFVIEKGKENWDHEHCEFCFRIIDTQSPDGYATKDNKHWICPDCFNDFKNQFDFVTVSPEDQQDGDSNEGLRPS